MGGTCFDEDLGRDDIHIARARPECPTCGRARTVTEVINGSCAQCRPVRSAWGYQLRGWDAPADAADAAMEGVLGDIEDAEDVA